MDKYIPSPSEVYKMKTISVCVLTANILTSRDEPIPTFPYSNHFMLVLPFILYSIRLLSSKVQLLFSPLLPPKSLPPWPLPPVVEIQAAELFTQSSMTLTVLSTLKRTVSEKQTPLIRSGSFS